MKLVHNLLVGILFFGSLSLIGYFTIVSESGPFAKKGKQLVIFFENAEGLKVGNKVTVLGVPAGTVVELDLVSVDEQDRIVPDFSPDRIKQKVAVAIELKKEVIFYSNYSVFVKNESLLSGKVIAIDPGNIKENNRYISRLNVKWYPSSEAERMGKRTIELFKNDYFKNQNLVLLKGMGVGDPIGSLSELINENRENVRKTIANIAEITEKINNGKGTVGLLINDSKLHDNANTVVSDAKIVVREMRESLEDTREQAPVTSFIRFLLTSF